MCRDAEELNPYSKMSVLGWDRIELKMAAGRGSSLCTEQITILITDEEPNKRKKKYSLLI